MHAVLLRNFVRWVSPPRGLLTATLSETTMAEMMDLDEESKKQLDKWVEAKRNRDFTSADRIRSLLEAKGIKPDQARPHVWEAPGQRKHGSHGPPQDGAHRMGNRATADSGERCMPGERSIPMSGAASSAPRSGMPPGIDASVGDWPCSACGNWNWARRKECNQCNASKSGLSAVKGTMVGTKRMGEGGGFKEFDDAAVRASRRPHPDAASNRRGWRLTPSTLAAAPPHPSLLPAAQDEQRKRRAMTEKSEKEERKAEKKKCEYCKRFACLC